MPKLPGNDPKITSTKKDAQSAKPSCRPRAYSFRDKERLLVRHLSNPRNAECDPNEHQGCKNEQPDRKVTTYAQVQAPEDRPLPAVPQEPKELTACQHARLNRMSNSQPAEMRHCADGNNRHGN